MSHVFESPCILIQSAGLRNVNHSQSKYSAPSEDVCSYYKIYKVRTEDDCSYYQIYKIRTEDVCSYYQIYNIILEQKMFDLIIRFII